MLKRLLYIMTVAATLASCDHRPLPVGVQELQELEELSTVEYTVTKVVKATDNQDIRALFGSRKIVFNTTSTVKAGFDLSELKEDDIVCDPRRRSIVLTLPQPKLLSLRMDPGSIKLVYENSTGLRGDFTAEERTALQVQGEKEIRQRVLELGLMDDARQLGRAFFEDFLHQCGYEKVTVMFRPERGGRG